jgi:glycine C-acetyltransferase
MLGDAVLAVRYAEALRDHGIYVIGFSHPVVPLGKARIRCQLSAQHTRADLQHAVQAFSAVKKQLGA